MLGASLAFALMASATKALGGSLPASEVVFVRSVLSVFLLLFYFLKIKGSIGWPGNKPKILTLRGVIGFIALFLYFWALPQIHLGTAVILNYTAPLFAVVGSYFILREKSSPTKNGLILLAFLGVYCIANPQGDLKSLPFLAALASGFLAGMVHLLIRRSSDEEESPALIIFYFTLVCTIGSVLFLPWGHWRLPQTAEWLLLLGITLSSFLGQIGLTYSLQKAPVSVVSPFGYITPVLGMLIGRWFWQENPGWMSYAGAAMIIVAGIFLYRKQR